MIWPHKPGSKPSKVMFGLADCLVGSPVMKVLIIIHRQCESSGLTMDDIRGNHHFSNWFTLNGSNREIKAYRLIFLHQTYCHNYRLLLSLLYLWYFNQYYKSSVWSFSYNRELCNNWYYEVTLGVAIVYALNIELSKT